MAVTDLFVEEQCSESPVEEVLRTLYFLDKLYVPPLAVTLFTVHGCQARGPSVSSPLSRLWEQGHPT